MHDQRLKNAVMRAARGGTELRRGGIVMVRLANGACGLCRAAELSNGDDMIRLSCLAGRHLADFNCTAFISLVGSA